LVRNGRTGELAATGGVGVAGAARVTEVAGVDSVWGVKVVNELGVSSERSGSVQMIIH